MTMVLLDGFEVQCLVNSMSDKVIINLQCRIHDVLEISNVFLPPMTLSCGVMIFGIVACRSINPSSSKSVLYCRR